MNILFAVFKGGRNDTKKSGKDIGLVRTHGGDIKGKD
jgi:hypothetical protein